MATLPLRSSESPLLHEARAFGRPPGLGECQALLTSLAQAPCGFGPVPASRPLALYGAGNLGRLARDFLKAVGLDFVMVIDRNARRMADDPAWSDAR